PDLVQEFRRTTVFTKPACRACWARYHCGGGCHANAEFFNGDLKQPYELGCALEKKRLECALYLKARLDFGLERELVPAEGVSFGGTE
ncbi:MAG: SPASM domain-containing protein, partial [Firmicutes bacterium]|nr:SPASM domain-containing protein [Bacillota bacterium]